MSRFATSLLPILNASREWESVVYVSDSLYSQALASSQVPSGIAFIEIWNVATGLIKCDLIVKSGSSNSPTLMIYKTFTIHNFNMVKDIDLKFG